MIISLFKGKYIHVFIYNNHFRTILIGPNNILPLRAEGICTRDLTQITCNVAGCNVLCD